MNIYISNWAIWTGNIREILGVKVAQGEIKASDIVWRGPQGDAVVAATAADVEEEYGDYTDAGQVSEYLD